MVLEAVCDYNLWFWHAFYGCAGSMNDLNVLRLSNIMKTFLNGDFAALEEDAGVVPFEIDQAQFRQLFLLVDGIYPKYSRFVKGIKDPLSQQEKSFSAWQEAARKDIERAFGVLQCQWKFMAHPINALSPDIIRRRVKTCIILHNMNVSDRVMEGDVRATYNHAYKLGVEEDNEESTQATGRGDSDSLSSSQDRWSQLSNANEHGRLFQALIRKY